MCFISLYIVSNKIDKMTQTSNRIIVFDMDETLGYFVELGMFWDALKNFYVKRKMSPHETSEEKSIQIKDITSTLHFCKVLDLFPEFIRPDMIKILEYIISKKNNNHCDKLMIYTNNQGPKSWANLISSYFDYSIENAVFDKVIGAFKVKGKHIELDRTTHDKTVDDLTRCAKIHKTTNICFLDDQYHPKMKNDNVYYINVKPYIYNLKYDEMAERYYNTFSNTFLDDVVDKNDFINEITSFMNEFRYTITDKTSKEFGVDKFISQRMMYHLKCFFNEPKRNKTIKKAKRKRNNGTKKH
jgi:hypothetical protein